MLAALQIAYRWQGQRSSEGILADAYLAAMTAPPAPRPLTKRQREVFDCVAAYIEKHGYAPTLDEIATAVGLRALASVFDHLSTLERKGWIVRERNEARSIRITEEAEIDFASRSASPSPVSKP
jgi:repressor LexA